MTSAAVLERRTVVEPCEARILVIEDKVTNFILIARKLAFMGVQHCDWKSSGWNALQFIPCLPRTDLILLDLHFPYENGCRLLQDLRANIKFRDAIICAITGEASAREMRRAKRAGFNGFLGKPLDTVRFPSQIRRLLAGDEVWEWR